ncbi:hypothetical protein [Phycicoccus sp. HDW14]|uniref:hypothetical protein n=1 Tax=Phycicoccus sp. HDW14 TaxID=2714941 RepID=UPI001F1128B7|nr:hypothetical protein [Phycicoccus sp. HDW14]
MLEVEEVVEEVAVVGLGDAEQTLHRGARQADLVALDDASAGEPLPDLELLDRVGVLEGHALVGRGERLERRLGVVGGEQLGGDAGPGLVVHGRSFRAGGGGRGASTPTVRTVVLRPPTPFRSRERRGGS